MTAENPSTLIICNAHDTANSHEIAVELQNYLQGIGGMEVGVQDYTDMTRLPENAPQDLILVYSSRSHRPSPLDRVIDDALTRVVERRMRSIVAVTTVSASLPPEWASIPTYDEASFPDKNVLGQSVLNATRHVKLSYAQEIALRLRPQSPQVVPVGRLAAPIWLMPALIVITCVLIIVAVGVTAFNFFPRQQAPTLSANSTATVLASKTTPVPGTKTTTPITSQSTPDANAKDRQKELDDIVKTSPAIKSFQTRDAWDTNVNDISSCAYSANNTNYTANIRQPAKYVPCLAANPSYKNFALQVTMDIKGDAGGIIFRSNTAKGVYYRLSVSQIYTGSTDVPSFSLFLCSNDSNKKCTLNDTDAGTQLVSTNAKVDQGPITLTVIARDKDIDIYADGKFLQRFTEPEGTAIGAGQVGVYAADLNHETTVTFSNLKIWSLDKP